MGHRQPHFFASPGNDAKGPLHLLIDSTGIKVEGEG